MNTVVTGNTSGLKPSELHALERVFRRRVRPEEVVSAELGGFLCELSRDIQRQVGLLINRRGEIEHVFVGDASRLELPEIGRLRAGRGRFRGLRLVHTHLRNEPLTRDDLVDLALLRLDLVAAIGMHPDGRPADLHVAHLLPSAPGPTPSAAPWVILPLEPFHRSHLDARAIVQALEEEFDRVSGVAVATDGRDRALLVVVELKRRSMPSQASRIDELKELCRTAGVRVRGIVEQRRPDPDPKTMIGRGKLEEVLIRAMQLDANVLIFDPDLTPGQAHAIADFTELRVIDRTMLILDIFAQRAKSRDGKLQVELAQLRYRLPRLHEKNTMMSRLTGGIGGRGPGETKLEENRRRARERINRLENEIEHYGTQRAGRRAQRGARGLPVVAIVGYTNAGKSTLLNTLTHSEVLAEDRLFATLDPTTRRLRFPREREIIIADTVGFIRDLPADLARAFRATLEELDQADLMLHLVDAADPDHENQIAAVEKILTELGLAETPRLMVMNKVDALDAEQRERVAATAVSGRPTFAISALSRDSTRPLLDAIETTLWKEGRLARAREDSALDEAPAVEPSEEAPEVPQTEDGVHA